MEGQEQRQPDIYGPDRGDANLQSEADGAGEPWANVDPCAHGQNTFQDSRRAPPYKTAQTPVSESQVSMGASEGRSCVASPRLVQALQHSKMMRSCI